MALNASAFRPDAPLPDARAVLADHRMSGAQREAAEAMLVGDPAQARALIEQLPRLLAEPRDGAVRLVELAIATDDAWLVDAVIAHGGLLDGDGDGAPLILALFARDPRSVMALLAAGATPAPAQDPLRVFRTAIAIGDPDRVDLLIRYGADPETVDENGRKPLHIALDMEQFRIAERLIEHGADLWAIDATGCNLGTAVTTPLIASDAAEAAAQDRLSQRALRQGWPDPVLTPAAVRAAALRGDWPPAAARARGAPAMDTRALAVMIDRERRASRLQ